MKNRNTVTFESFVNSERCKTQSSISCNICRLRALLIQKDVKLCLVAVHIDICLRALLIQKDVKQNMGLAVQSRSLRALLIQKDVKPSREVIA